MTTKTVFQTNAFGLYVGTVEADLSPLEPEVYLIPGGCVELAPPDAPEHKAARWNGKAWELIDYLDGVTAYSIVTGEPLELDGHRPVPSGYTLKKPTEGQIWKNGDWVDDVPTILANLYADRLASINRECSRYIESGFTSQALGWVFTYASELDDQINLTGMILCGNGGDFACYDEAGVKAFRAHTAEQLREVGEDLVRFKHAALLQADALKTNLETARSQNSISALKAIDWVAPA